MYEICKNLAAGARDESQLHLERLRRYTIQFIALLK